MTDHDHEHSHADDADLHHEHDEGRLSTFLHRAGHLIPIFHSHPEGAHEPIIETHERGIWATKIGLAGLGITALLQLGIVMLTGSVALLADTAHNFTDAATSIPLWIAFVLARRGANERYRYGYGRLEDLAGAFIVLMILGSALFIGYESISRLIDPRPVDRLWLVAVAAVVGFAGNEAVARFRIRIGRQFGSAALVADGQHARADALTSLAVLFGAIGVSLGFPAADPIVGLLIAFGILFLAYHSGREVWARLTDAVDPVLVSDLERAALSGPGVEQVTDLRARWVGHSLHVEATLVVDEDLSTAASHALAEEARHRLLHAHPRAKTVSIHVNPCGHSGADHHATTSHHLPDPAA